MWLFWSVLESSSTETAGLQFRWEYREPTDTWGDAICQLSLTLYTRVREKLTSQPPLLQEVLRQHILQFLFSRQAHKLSPANEPRWPLVPSCGGWVGTPTAWVSAPWAGPQPWCWAAGLSSHPCQWWSGDFSGSSFRCPGSSSTFRFLMNFSSLQVTAWIVVLDIQKVFWSFPNIFLSSFLFCQPGNANNWNIFFIQGNTARGPSYHTLISDTCNFNSPITWVEDRIQMERLELILGNKLKFTNCLFDNLVYLSSRAAVVNIVHLAALDKEIIYRSESWLSFFLCCCTQLMHVINAIQREQCRRWEDNLLTMCIQSSASLLRFPCWFGFCFLT